MFWQSGEGRRLIKPISVAVICFLGIIAYSNSFHNSFHFDDQYAITENIAIRDIGNLTNIWNFWPTRFITFLSVALNYHFNGLDVFGYHVVNFLTHSGTALSVWWLALLLVQTPAMDKDRISPHSGMIAFFAGALFMLHPIQTQPVNYIIQRATLIASFFYVAAVCLYVKARLMEYADPGSAAGKMFFGGAIASAAISMFAKENSVSLPLAIALCEICFFTTSGKGIRWRSVAPFFVIAAIIPVTMFMTQSADFAGMKRAGEDDAGIPAGHYFLTQLKVIVTYIRLLLIPINQNFDYDYPIARSVFETPVIVSFLFLIAVLSVAIALFKRSRLISFGIFWFFVTVFPESGIVPIKDVIFEHRLYLPMAGYSISLVGAVFYVFGKKGMKAVIVILSVLAILYSGLTYSRNFVWKSNTTLWENNISASPNKARPYINRGTAYRLEGDLDKAIADYNKAIEIAPHARSAYVNRGTLHLSKGNIDQAISDYNKAIAMKPDDIIAYNNRAGAYLKRGDLDKAIVDYDKVIELKPGYAVTYYNRAILYFNKKEYAKSWQDLYQAQKLGYKANPGFIESLRKASGQK